MSYTRWEDWHVWLLDKNRKPVRKLVDLASFSCKLGCFGQGSFTCTLPSTSNSASYLKTDEEMLIYARRRNKEFVFIIDRINRRKEPIELSGRVITAVLSFRVIHDASYAALELTGYIDDVMKDFVRYSAESGNVYAGPDGNAREIPGLSVAANKSECPTSKTIKRGAGCLFDLLQYLGVTYDVDFELVPTWAAGGCTWEFETWYPIRGTDRTRNNGSVPPVVITDIIRVVKSGEWYADASDYRNAAYNRDLGSVVTSSDYANFWRREIQIDAVSDDDVTLEMYEYRRKEGYSFDFRESEGCRVGVDFWVGDKLTYNNVELGVPDADDTLAFVEFRIGDTKDGNEEVILTFGDPKPSLADKMSRRGRRRRPLDGGSGYAWALKGDAGTLVGPDSDNAVTVEGGTNITVTEVANQYKLVVSGTGPAGASFVAPAVTFGSGHVIGSSGNVIHSDSVIALGMIADDANVVYPDSGNNNRWTVAGGTGITTSGSGSTLTVTHASDASAIPDAHHAGFIGLKDDAGSAAAPDVNDYIQLAQGAYISIVKTADSVITIGLHNYSDSGIGGTIAVRKAGGALSITVLKIWDGASDTDVITKSRNVQNIVDITMSGSIYMQAGQTVDGLDPSDHDHDGTAVGGVKINHGNLLNVTEDQHHTALVALLGDTGEAVPSATNKIGIAGSGKISTSAVGNIVTVSIAAYGHTVSGATASSGSHSHTFGEEQQQTSLVNTSCVGIQGTSGGVATGSVAEHTHYAGGYYVDCVIAHRHAYYRAVDSGSGTGTVQTSALGAHTHGVGTLAVSHT